MEGRPVDVFFFLVATLAFVVGVLALVKGSIQWLRIGNRKVAAAVIGAGFMAFLVGGALSPVDSRSPDPPAPRASSESTSNPPVREAPAALPAPARPAGVPLEAQEARVTRHVDGDTLWLEGGTLPALPGKSVRLLEIDSPEVGNLYSAEASGFLKQELPVGATVYLLADRGDTDGFGRYLRYLWKSNGEFFNDKAVRQGFAKAVLIAPNDLYISQIRAAELEAKAARRGLWNIVAAPPPPAPALRAPAPPPPAPAPAPPPPVPAAAPAGNCDASYPDFCIAPAPPDLDCADIGRRFTVVQPDPHQFDGRAGQVGEPDGVGCESYG